MDNILAYFDRHSVCIYLVVVSVRILVNIKSDTWK